MAVVRAWGAGGAKWLRGKEKRKKMFEASLGWFSTRQAGQSGGTPPLSRHRFHGRTLCPRGALGECGVELPAGGRPPPLTGHRLHGRPLCPRGALGEGGVELPAGGRPPRPRGPAPPSRFQRQ